MLRHQNRYTQLKQKDTGAILVEIALTLPIFLILILFILWYATYANARSALTTSVLHAPSLGVTRARSEFIDSGFYPLHHYTGALTPDYDGLLYSSVDIASARDYYGSVDPNFFRFEDGTNPGTLCPIIPLEDLPKAYIFTLAYAYLSMKQSTDNQLRFPCDPNTEDGGNCMWCYFKQPHEDIKNPWTCSDTDEVLDLMTRHFTLVCEYSPSNVIYDAIRSLGAQFFNKPNIGVIKREKYL